MEKFAVVTKFDEVSCQVGEQIRKALANVLEFDLENPDLVISVGGDGTMLESVHRYLTKDVLFVGVHTGTLGFFTDYQKEEIDQLVTDIKAGKYVTTARHLLEVTIHQTNRVSTYYALNEIRLDQGFVTQVLDVCVNDELLEVFRGNGLCISTPSGSTAYNKSIGGAVMYPGHPLMQISEVAGIQHNAYRSLGSSLILDDRQVVSILPHKTHEIHMSVDHLSFELKNVEKITITIGKKTIGFAGYRDLSFIKRVRRAFISQ